MNNQSPNSKQNRLGKLVIGHWLLFSYWCLVIGVWNCYALNLDKVKASFLSDDYKSAISEGEKILATSTNQSANLDELYYILALSYLKDGNYLRSSDIFEIIISEFKNSPFFDEAKIGLGDSFFLKGDFAKAQNYYKELIKDNPQTKLLPLVYLRISQCAAKLGDMQETMDYLDKLEKNFPLSLELKNNQDLQSRGFYYTVQVGCFSNTTNAKNLTDKLIQEGYPAYIEELNLEGQLSYRVRVGKFIGRQQAEDTKNKLLQQGYYSKIFP